MMGADAKRSKKFSIKASTISVDNINFQIPCVARTKAMREQGYSTIIRMYIFPTPSGGRRPMAQEGITKMRKHELEEPIEQKFEIVGELVELVAQNAIYTI